MSNVAAVPVRRTRVLDKDLELDRPLYWVARLPSRPARPAQMPHVHIGPRDASLVRGLDWSSAGVWIDSASALNNLYFAVVDVAYMLDRRVARLGSACYGVCVPPLVARAGTSSPPLATRDVRLSWRERLGNESSRCVRWHLSVRLPQIASISSAARSIARTAVNYHFAVMRCHTTSPVTACQSLSSERSELRSTDGFDGDGNGGALGGCMESAVATCPSMPYEIFCADRGADQPCETNPSTAVLQI